MSADGEGMALAPFPADTAPKDGRVIRGYFERAGTRELVFKAVAWSGGWWVDLYERRLDRGWALVSWGAD